MPESITVNLGERAYPILFGANLADEIRTCAEGLDAAGRRVVVVTDRNVVGRQAGELRAMLGMAPSFALPAGEEAKSLGEFGRLLDFLAAARLDRGGVVFAVGGGVVGDLAGFAAASYLRGVDYYQVPTTLLAMVDSSVGGKTGINLSAGKNLAGAFHQPRGVFVATDFLATLPAREFAAGTAEVIKYGLLGAPSLFSGLDKPLTPKSPGLAEVIRNCCAIKARIVEADERELAESGGRALLNLGHTFAHAIERCAGFGTYLHGEAVAVGLCAAARLSRLLGMLAASDVARIEATVAAHALPIRLRAPMATVELMAAMFRDKKARAGALRFIVLEAPGKAVVRSDVPADLVEAAWKEVGAG